MNFTPLSALNAAQLDRLVALYQDEWWSKGRQIEDVRELLAHSDFIFGFADASQNLAAFARVLTDRVYKAFIFDVIIAPEFRDKGLGKRLVDAILNHPVISRVKHVELYCQPDKVTFYEQWGFSKDTGGIVLMRKSQA